MLQEYLYEIIALIFVTTLLIIYVLTLKFKKDEQDVLKSIQKKETKTVQNIQVNPVEQKKPKVEVTQEPEVKEESKKTTSTQPRKTRKKIEVPPHDKILKENFEEFSGVKILVAEDNIINQKVISGLLADSGIEVTMADDGQYALDILEENSDFDFILMDANMPRVDGFQATRAIRSDPKYDHIVIVAQSGDIAPDDVRKMKHAGMEEHLEKPLRMDPLYDILYAYTYAKTTKQLDSEQGLLVCGGDSAFYKEILNEFIHDYTNSAQEISNFLKVKDVHSADSLLLDFIGVTANIGAESIHSVALELKESIKDMKQNNFDKLLKKYDQYLKTLINEIEEYTK